MSADVAISFVFEGELVAWRSWPVVPRVGENVALPHYDNPAVSILYTVQIVNWAMPESPPVAKPGTLTVSVIVSRGQDEVRKYRKRRGTQ